MKKLSLLLMALLLTMTTTAQKSNRQGSPVPSYPLLPMLEEGKTWYYAHCQVNDDETGYMDIVCYEVKGDTVIDGRNYKKVYRRAENTWKWTYHAALREEADGRVFAYDLNGNKQDTLLMDFFMNEFDGRSVTVHEGKIKVNGRLLRRFSYSCQEPDGPMRDLDFVAVEGVGFRTSVPSPFRTPVPSYQSTSISDYEEFVMASGGSLGYFTDADFSLPTEVELTDAERQLVKYNNDFAFRLFHIAHSDGDRILSPLSITMALSLLNNAADGQTRDEIISTLIARASSFIAGDSESPTPTDLLNSYCHKMLTACDALDPATKVNLANTIFASDRYRLHAPFVQTAREWYDADVQTRNFYDVEGTVADINQWANDHTEGMIDKVIGAQEFDRDAISYLLNAIYFKGAWANPFKPENTCDEVFQGSGIVPMMHLNIYDAGGFDYKENKFFQAVVLPYGNHAYSMTVYLPREDKTIDDVLNYIAFSSLQPQPFTPGVLVDLKLPRFETDTDLALNDIMTYLGMPSAFNQSVSLIPWLCEDYNAYISLMKQVARIKVNEQGTEAAAVTIVGGTATSEHEQEIATFHANRPFFYIITEQSTGAILFMGQYVGKQPTKTDFSQGLTQLRTSDPQHSSDGIQNPRSACFNLAGQRLQAPPAKGLYISGGKKVVR